MTPSRIALRSLALSTLLTAGAVIAHGAATVTPSRASDSTGTAAGDSLAVALQDALDRGRAELGAHGVSAAVILRDGRTWRGVSGEAYAGTPVTPETVFEIASVTKTFTATLAVQLAHEGVFSLDDRLERWFPDFPRADRITLRHLLSHTSGIAEVMEHPRFVPTLISDPTRRWRPEETFEFLADPHFAPGEGWRYSNTGYHLVGMVIEESTDRTLHQLLRERFFDPLELSRTFFGAYEDVPGPRAHAFLDFDQDGEVDDLSAVIPPTSFLTAAWSAGAVLSSAEDLARWIRALHTGDVLAEEGYARMKTLVDRPDGRRYGLGLLADEREGVLLYGHEGNSTGFGAAAWHAPEEGLTVVVLANIHATRVRPVTRRLLGVLSER